MHWAQSIAMAHLLKGTLLAEWIGHPKEEILSSGYQDVF